MQLKPLFREDRTLDHFQKIAETVSEPLDVLDPDFPVKSASHSSYQHSELSDQEYPDQELWGVRPRFPKREERELA